MKWQKRKFQKEICPVYFGLSYMFNELKLLLRFQLLIEKSYVRIKKVTEIYSTFKRAKYPPSKKSCTYEIYDWYNHFPHCDDITRLRKYLYVNCKNSLKTRSEKCNIYLCVMYLKNWEFLQRFLMQINILIKMAISLPLNLIFPKLKFDN